MTTKSNLFAPLAALLVSLALPTGSAAQARQPEPGLADMAALSLSAATILRAEITRTTEVRPDRAPGLAPGYRRLFVRADVRGVVAAAGPVEREIRYLVDVPETARGRAPRLKGADMLLFLGPEQRPGEYALAHKYGQQAWSAQRESTARRIAEESARESGLSFAPAAIESAFHVTGTLPGESESQIFVRTAADARLSLVVLRRPGTAPLVNVATGDFIDPNAPPPQQGTLPVIALACSLPERLPDDAVMEPRVATQLRTDYQAALAALGGCDRNF
ncbi:MAG: hypothetical protein V2J26_08730 [Pacificimonas sp.]|jgi:hypothetical protein|nr:hypothetical protein [Pacificimonas sp.]